MTDPALRAVLAAFPGRRILVLGDLILDEYLWGDAAPDLAQSARPRRGSANAHGRARWGSQRGRQHRQPGGPGPAGWGGRPGPCGRAVALRSARTRRRWGRDRGREWPPHHYQDPGDGAESASRPSGSRATNAGLPGLEDQLLHWTDAHVARSMPVSSRTTPKGWFPHGWRSVLSNSPARPASRSSWIPRAVITSSIGGRRWSSRMPTKSNTC